MPIDLQITTVLEVKLKLTKLLVEL